MTDTERREGIKEIEQILKRRKITPEEVREQKISLAMAESLSGDRTLSRDFVTPIIDGVFRD